MNKKQKVATGIIATLMLTNGATAYQYWNDKNILQGEIESQGLVIEKKNVQLVDLGNVISEQKEDIDTYKDRVVVLDSKVVKLNKKVKKKDKKIKQQSVTIDGLKDQLNQAKKRNKESP